MDFYWAPGIYLLNAKIVEKDVCSIAVSLAKHHKVHRCFIQFPFELSEWNLDDILGSVKLKMMNGQVRQIETTKIQSKMLCVADLDLTLFDPVKELEVSVKITSGVKCSHLSSVDGLCASDPGHLNVLPQIYLETEYLTPSNLLHLTYDFLCQTMIPDLAKMCMLYFDFKNYEKEHLTESPSKLFNLTNDFLCDDHKFEIEELTGNLEPWIPLKSYENQEVYNVPKLDPLRNELMDVYVLESDVDNIRQISYLSSGNVVLTVHNLYWKSRTNITIINGLRYRKIPIFINVTTLTAAFNNCDMHIVRYFKSNATLTLWKYRFQSPKPLDSTQIDLFDTSIVQTHRENTFSPNMHDSTYSTSSNSLCLFYRFVMILRDNTNSAVYPRVDSRGQILHPVKSISIISRRSPDLGIRNYPIIQPIQRYLRDFIFIQGDGHFFHRIVPMSRGEKSPESLIYQYIFNQCDLDTIVLDRNYAKPSLEEKNRFSWDIYVEWNNSIIDMYYKDQSLRLDLYVERENRIACAKGSFILRYV